MIKDIKRIDLCGVNCYLLETDTGFVLIDTGGCTFYNTKLSAIRNKLEAELEAAGCISGRLNLVILTHGDSDHSGNCAFIRKKFHVPIVMHSEDSELVENPSWANLVTDSVYQKKSFAILMKLIIALNGSKFKKTIEDFEKFKPDSYLDDGFDLLQYGLDARILHIPGHTRGSIGILTSGGDFFSGDTFANISKPSIAPNAYDFDILNSSIDKLKELHIKTVYPGHGKPFSINELYKII